MTLVYNIQPAEIDIEITQNDTLNMLFNVQKWNEVTEAWEDWDLSGNQIDGHFRRKDGLLMKEITSSGVSPEITILGSTYTIYCEGIDFIGFLDYDIQVTDGPDTYTFQRGEAHFIKELTP